MRHNTLAARILWWTMTILTVLASVGLLVSAYCGRVSPLTLRYAPLVAMTLPVWTMAVTVMLALDVMWCRRAALVAAVAILLCLPQLGRYCPVHLPRSVPRDQRDRAFTLMSYNVMMYGSQDDEVQLYTNPQLDYVLQESPDIAVLVEAGYMEPNWWNHITQEQIDALSRMYPYIYVSEGEFTFLSKFEAESLPIHYPAAEQRSGNMAGWRVDIHGHTVNIIGVHLQSLRYDNEQKELFQQATTPDDLSAGILKDVRYELLPKFVKAAQKRVPEYEFVARVVAKYGGENVIVCGDFNDLAWCYGINYLEDECRLRQAYTQVGLGPMVTFNAYHFLFHIDHILYRGDLCPVSMRRGDIRASDHYPVAATFVIE